MMKKIMGLLLSLIMVVSLCACGVSRTAVEVPSAEIEDKILSTDLREAYDLCMDTLSLEGLTDEQRVAVEAYQSAILELAYPGTFVVKPDSIITVTPMEIGKNSYFTVGILQDYDEVFCRYTFDKMSEKELAAQQYQEYLEAKYKYLDLKVGDNYVSYVYSDESGNSIKLQVFDESYGSADFVILLDSDLFDLARIDTSAKNASLLDTGILITQ